MILGIGIDLIETERLAKAIERPGFLDRILTPNERAQCKTLDRVAGRWAVKEAIAKAIGLDLKWHEVEVLNDENGKPVATIRSEKFDPERQRIHVSISHERANATAIAIWEQL